MAVCLSLSGTVLVYIRCPNVIINSALFHSPKYPGLDDELCGHPVNPKADPSTAWDMEV